MMNGLEVPDALTGIRIQAEKALGVNVVAVTHTTPVVVRGGRRGQVDITQLVIGGHHRPDVGIARLFPRLVFPGLVELLPWTRNRMKAPLELSRMRIVRPYVTRRTAVVQRVIEYLRTNDNGVADNDGGCAVSDILDIEVTRTEIVGEIDDAFRTELGIRASGCDVD